MRRKFPVLHRPCGLTRAQVRLLLRLQRATRVFLHRRLFLLEWHFFLRRWIPTHQRRPIGLGRSTVYRVLISRRRRRRRIVGGVAAFIGSRRRQVRFREVQA